MTLMRSVKEAICYIQKENKNLPFSILKAIQIRFNPAYRRHRLVGDPFKFKMWRDFQIRFLMKKGLNPSDKLLEIGCGTLRGGIPIIRFLNKGNYYGFDVRENVIEEANKEINKCKLKNKNPKLIYTSNINNLIVSSNFNVIWAFLVLIHMEDNILEDTLSFVSKHLEPDGIFFTNVNLGSRKNLGNWAGFPVKSRPLEFYRELGKKHGLVVNCLGELKKLGFTTNGADLQHMLEIKKFT